jgi:hypothetical protein
MTIHRIQPGFLEEERTDDENWPRIRFPRFHR